MRAGPYRRSRRGWKRCNRSRNHRPGANRRQRRRSPPSPGETKAEERYARLTYALYLEEEQIIPAEAEMDPRSLDTVLDLMVEATDLSSPRPPASKYIDPSYRERARGTLEAAGR